MRENIWREKIRESFSFINRRIKGIKQRRESKSDKVDNQEGVVFYQPWKETFKGCKEIGKGENADMPLCPTEVDQITFN